MKTVATAAALTGSCAFLYLLYHMKTNLEGKRSHSKKKMQEQSDLCVKDKENKNLENNTQNANSISSEKSSLTCSNTVGNRPVEIVEDESVCLSPQESEDNIICNKEIISEVLPQESEDNIICNKEIVSEVLPQESEDNIICNKEIVSEVLPQESEDNIICNKEIVSEVLPQESEDNNKEIVSEVLPQESEDNIICNKEIVSEVLPQESEDNIIYNKEIVSEVLPQESEDNNKEIVSEVLPQESEDNIICNKEIVSEVLPQESEDNNIIYNKEIVSEVLPQESEDNNIIYNKEIVSEVLPQESEDNIICNKEIVSEVLPQESEDNNIIYNKEIVSEVLPQESEDNIICNKEIVSEVLQLHPEVPEIEEMEIVQLNPCECDKPSIESGNHSIVTTLDDEINTLENIEQNYKESVCPLTISCDIHNTSVEEVPVKMESTCILQSSLISHNSNENSSLKSISILEHQELNNKTKSQENNSISTLDLKELHNKNDSHENNFSNGIKSKEINLISSEISSESENVPKNTPISKKDKKNVMKSEKQSNLPEIVKSSPAKSRRHRRRGKRAAQLKELEVTSEITQNQVVTKSSNTFSKESLSDSKEKSPSKTDIKGEFLSIESKNLENETSTSSPDHICTSDLEREASLTPEQENVTVDSQSLISQASLDSGQGSIEVDQDTLFSNVTLPESSCEQYILHHFEVPQILVGKLIGRKGAFLNKLKAATATSIILVNHTDKNYKLCSVEGKKWQVLQALDLIREHFPSDQFPELTLSQVNTPLSSPQHQPQMNRQILQVELPPGVVLEVQASAVISTGVVWLQQPLHPTFSALQRLHQCLNINYGDGSSTPILPLPIPPNTVCVCQVGSQWLRCQVLEHDHTNCSVTLLDVGGHCSLPISLLRQIRVDYIGLPFQATQCYLYGIEPNNESGWEEAGRIELLQLARNNIIYATIAAYSQDGIPLVNLYQRQYNQYTFINDKLVELGHAKWIAAEVGLAQSG